MEELKEVEKYYLQNRKIKKLEHENKKYFLCFASSTEKVFITKDLKNDISFYFYRRDFKNLGSKSRKHYRTAKDLNTRI